MRWRLRKRSSNSGREGTNDGLKYIPRDENMHGLKKEEEEEKKKKKEVKKEKNGKKKKKKEERSATISSKPEHQQIQGPWTG